MTPGFVNSLLSNEIWVIAKIFAIILILLYLVFAGVIIRQVHLMTSSVEMKLGGLLRTIALFHFIGVLVVLFLAIITL